jgi:hypothetical protein
LGEELGGRFEAGSVVLVQDQEARARLHVDSG